MLVKGRGNYLSLRRLDNGARARPASLFADDEEFDQLRQISDWARSRPTTARWPISTSGPLPQVWDEVASDNGNCMGRNCPQLQGLLLLPGPAPGAQRPDPGRQPRPVLQRPGPAARRAPASCPTTTWWSSTKPTPSKRVAGDHLGLGVTSGQVDYMLNKLYNDRTNRGLLVHHRLGEAQQQVLECRDRADDFFDDVDAWLAEPAAAATAASASRRSCRIRSAKGSTKLAGMVRQHGRRAIERPDERQDFIAGRRPADGAGRRDRRLARASGWPTRSTGSRRSRSAAPAADHAGRRPDRRRAGPARAAVRRGRHASS